MIVYLVQHGDALGKDIDADRPLSGQGRADIERAGSALRRADIRLKRIAHSGKTRAKQTAEILGNALADAPAPETLDGLAPNDPVEPWAEMADAAQDQMDRTMLVGHMPFMGRLVSRLVSGNESGHLVRFRPGTVVCLEKDESSGWAIAWMIRPELA